VRNANDSISLAQTAEGAMGEISSALSRMRTLATQASTSTYGADDRKSLNFEVASLVAEISRIATDTKFNGMAIMDGTYVGKDTFVGTEASHVVSLTIGNVGGASLGVGSGSSYSATLAGGAVTAVAALAAGAISINGFNVGATVADGVSQTGDSSSAISVAAAINAVSGDTNVSAVAQATTVAGTAATTFGTAIASAGITINGVNIGAIAASTAAGDRGSDVAAAINAVTGQTGVTATFATTGAVALSAADGRNITVVTAADVTGDISGLQTGADAETTVTTKSSVTLSTTASAGITIGGQAEATGGFATAGLTAATATAGAGVSSIDITTQAGALLALATLDSAISQLGTERANLGSFQNRLNHTVSNLMQVAENTSAARSRIADTDYAVESANLAKAQVLQQAGTAMLAQANASGQSVLSLLK
jgi:flagellin